MSTIRQMLPHVAQPFTEAIVGAGLGALVSRFILKGDMSTGAMIGGVAGYGLALTKARGAFPFTATAGGVYTGDSVTQYPTFQQGYAQPYGGFGQGYAQPYYGLGQGAEYVEEEVPEVIPEVIPEYGWPRRRDEWRRGGRGGHHHGWGHGGGYGGWGHGWRR